MQKEWMHERLESMQPLWPSQIKHTSPKLLEKNWVLAEADGTGKVFVPWVRNSAAVAANALNQSSPETAQTQSLSCSLEIKVNNNHAHL
jgi:hypothetical protein